MLRRNSIIIVLLLFCSFCALAQEEHRTWSLEACVKYAMENSPRIKKQGIAIDNAKISVIENKWAFVPTLRFSSSYTMSTGRVLDPTTYQFVETSYTGNSSSSLNGEVTLFEGGRKPLSLERAKLALQFSILQNEALREDLALNVIAAYLDASNAKAQIKIAEETAELVKAQLDRSRELFTAGSITESDVIQLQSQLFNAETDVSSAKNLYEMAMINLCDLLEVDDYWTVEIIEPSCSNNFWEGLAAEDIVETHPEYRASALSEQLAELDLKISRAALSPRITISAGYGSSFSDARKKAVQTQEGGYKYESYPFWNQYGDNASTYASVGLSIPILNGLTARNGIKRAKNALLEAKYTTAETARQIRKQYLQAQVDCRAAREQYYLSVEELQYAEEAQRQVNEKYNLGTADYSSWVSATVELTKARYSCANKNYLWILRQEILKTYCSQ